MTTVQTTLFALPICLGLAGAAAANPATHVTHTYVAAAHCPADWSRLVALQPETWSQFQPMAVDPALPAPVTEAANKYAVAVIALSDYIGAFVGLSDVANQTPAALTLAEARYDLAMCLTPTQAERRQIVDHARTRYGGTEADLAARLFEGFDRFDCMQFAQASDALFDTGTSEQDDPIDFAALTAEHMKDCR